MRNLTKALAVASLLAPASGHSLGIGNIKLHSALNQNLNAEISLVVSAGEKASDIKVNLAPPDKFDEAGVPWASFLSKIRFTTVVGANGSVLIKLSSREAVKEPFLDFLLEVNWPKGSLYREFTVLLDPPAVYKQATLPVLTPSESYESEQPVIPQQIAKKRQQASVEPRLAGATEYGPTRRNDTLWKVAERAGRQEGVSVEQMMIAMYEQNPHAFYKENVHALLAGKTLKIPEREVVLKLSRKQALAEFNRQTKTWKNRLASASVETASAKKDIPENQLTLVAPTKADVAENLIVAPENQQVTAIKKVDELPSPSKTVKEVVSATSPVNDVLQSKIAELEKQLVTMQQIVALKDQQLAALQNQSQVKPVIQAEPVQTVPDQSEAINPVTQQKPVEPVDQPVIKPESQATSSSNAYYLWVGGFGAGTLSILGWLWWRKRKFDEKTTIDSLFAAANFNKTPDANRFFSTSLDNDTANSANAVGSSSLFSEFTFSDFDTFDTDHGEIDPVSEADVYLAYGRYQQAEDLMRDVIKDQPDRDECKLKLLEIFYSKENKQAFEAYARELAEAGKKDDIEFWAKVTEMGSEICQDSTLFSNGSDEFSSKNNTLFTNNIANRVESGATKIEEETGIDKPDFSLSSFSKSFNNDAIKEVPRIQESLFNNGMTSFDNEVDDVQQNNESIDFNLSPFATDTTESKETDEGVASNTHEIEGFHEFDSFDFDFGSTDKETKESDDRDYIIADDDSDESNLRRDLLDDKTSDSDYSFANNFFDGDYDDDLDKPAIELDGQDFDDQDRFDVFDLTDMDQLETKLDLAKAYIDMSDADAAKDMAWEVLEKGTEEQKKIAQALLNDLK